MRVDVDTVWVLVGAPGTDLRARTLREYLETNNARLAHGQWPQEMALAVGDDAAEVLSYRRQLRHWMEAQNAERQQGAAAATEPAKEGHDAGEG